ncbi:MAG: TIGR01212 family radical SAM protein [Muribaculaceae bacterium]|nr:TIGR01212 family radical SAM protein [Muribaculaceae bacterium]
MKAYSDYLSEIFPGIKVQKISIDAGFSCPNRDGRISKGGCIYCRNDSFSPRYCNPNDSVSIQLEKGKKFFAKKYPDMKYLAYFQSYTGTYNKTIQQLYSLYKEALMVDKVVGLVVGTRPDCLDDETLNLLAEINKNHPVFLEIGAETSHNHTLKLINRNHTWEDVENCVKKISSKKIHCGLHLIAGLPGESDELILSTIDKACKLPIESLKLHQLQVLKGTILHTKICSGDLTVPELSLDKYLDLCIEIIERVPDNIVIERFLAQAPPDLVVSPSWGLKNYQFINLLQKKLVTSQK